MAEARRGQGPDLIFVRSFLGQQDQTNPIGHLLACADLVVVSIPHLFSYLKLWLWQYLRPGGFLLC